MIKGHTTIELTNVKTGEKETVEYDNMVTNAVAEYLCNPWTGISINPQVNVAYATKPYVDVPNIGLHKFGGLYLFEDEVSESAQNYDFPTDNTLIGCGGMGITSNDECIQRGSYNSGESGINLTNKTATLVFDFTTQQANGQISCVCLGNAQGAPMCLQGEVPTPNENLTRTNPQFLSTLQDNTKSVSCGQALHGTKTFFLPDGSSVSSINCQVDWLNISDAVSQHKLWLMVGVYDNYIIYAEITDTSHIKLHYVYDNICSLSILNRTYGTTQATVAKTESVELDIPFAGASLLSAGITDGVAVFLNATNDGSKRSIYLYTYNFGTGDVGYKEVALTGQLTANSICSRASSCYTHAHGNLYCSLWDYQAQTLYALAYTPYIINISTGVTTRVTCPFMDNYRTLYPSASSRTGHFVFTSWGGKDWLIMSASDLGSYTMWALNLSTNVMYPILCNAGSQSEATAIHGDITKQSDQYGMMFSGRSYYGEVEDVVIKSPFYLATINNLDNPVIKTADKTMKVTYVLTEV